ncbi:MAG: nicotinate phosphoribosyltransferase [Chlamydiales bacterium]
MPARPKSIYRTSLALFTDLYELTMAYGFWKQKMADRKAVFHLFFRRNPFKGSFAIAAGLETAAAFIEDFRFEESDLTYLESLRENGKPLFEKGFLDYLRAFSFTCDLDAMPEGTPVFPYEPLLRVTAPLIQAQFLESLLLNIINFQTLIATKAARISWAAHPDPVIEFGLRRAQGIDGALSASRAAFIGGCVSTSNVLAGKLYGIPVVGTHAHSWIMAFESELASFRAFAEVLPSGSIFLIDTYNTLQGAEHAIAIAKEMRKIGKEMGGVRLDSGDFAQLSIEVRKKLDAEGFPHTKIMASNELDEETISDLKHQGTKVTIWGVGTHLITGKDQPALDGVYKLSALQNAKGAWEYKLKISETLAKVTDPGILQVRRFSEKDGYVGDMIYNVESKLTRPVTLVNPLDPTQRKEISESVFQDLLVPVLRQGKSVYTHPSLQEIQMRAKKELEKFPQVIRRFLNPPPYFVGLEKALYDLKLQMIADIKKREKI